MKWWTIFGAIIALFFTNALYAAENDTTEIINVKSISYTIDGQESVKFQFSAPLTPKIFTMKGENPRLVIDLPRAKYRGGNVVVPEGAQIAGNLRIGLHTEPEVRTRVVLDLNPAKKVTFSQVNEAETLTITLSGVDKEVAAVPPALAPAKEEKQDATPVADVPAADKEQTAAKQDEVASTTAPAPEPAATPAVTPVATPEKEVKPAAAETAAKEAVPASKKMPLVVTPAASKEGKTRDVKAKEEKATEVVAKEPEVTTQKKAKKSPAEKTVPPVFAVKTDPGKGKKKPLESKGAELLDVRFDDSSEKGEMVLFHLNDFYPPSVTAIETDNPGVVCEFTAMSVAPAVEETIFANGKFVERIRTEKQADTDKVKVFLDLAPNYDYDLQQVFFKTDNLFVLIINELGGDKKGETAAK